MKKKVALVFGGQGTQYIGMGKELYDSYSEARTIFEIANNVIGNDIAKLCFESSITDINMTVFCQPCILAVELAIFEVFKKAGGRFDAVAGHSLGEYAALVAAGVIDAKTAFELVKYRAVAMQQEIPNDVGKMVAVINLDIEKINVICEKYGQEKVAIANYNSFNQTTVSVANCIYDEFINCVQLANGRAIPLKVNRPYHHSMMIPAADKFKPRLNNVLFQKPSFPIYLNVTGETLEDKSFLVQSLYEHIFSPVQWVKTIQNMIAAGVDAFYEVSPKPVLKSLINNIAGTLVKTYDVQTLQKSGTKKLINN